jgi:alkylated DNA repair dioxygenase AlkB
MWRLGAGQPLPHPVLAQVHKAIERRYGVQFTGFGLIQYRDGSDGQAFHRDTDMRYLEDTVIAILTLGAERPWHLRPKAVKRTLAELDSGKGATHDLSPCGGDLIVMGGRCQAEWEHSVPYLLGRSSVGTRISLQWRYARKTGKPFPGAGYRAPVHYSDR